MCPWIMCFKYRRSNAHSWAKCAAPAARAPTSDWSGREGGVAHTAGRPPLSASAAAVAGPLTGRHDARCLSRSQCCVPSVKLTPLSRRASELVWRTSLTDLARAV